MKNKKVLIISVSLILVLIIAIIATSYAMFSADLTGTKENKLTTGNVKMNCEETTFSLLNTQPMSDTDGMELSDNTATCILTSEMTGTMQIGYDVALTEVTASNVLSEENVKIRAYKSIDGGNIENLAGTTSSAGVTVGSLSTSYGTYDTSIPYRLDSAIVEGNHSIVYTIKAWVTSVGDVTNTTTTSTGECTNSTYTTQSACETAGEIWGSSNTSSRAGGNFSFKLKIGATQVYND